MISIMSLWLPILLSAVAVFFVSFLTHMVLKYHSTDFTRLPAEDQVMEALARHNIPQGEYMFPHASGADAMKDPVFVEKRNRGPAGILTVMPTPAPALPSYLGQWFIFSVVVTVFAAYLASRALPVGAEGSEVLRFTGTVAFLGYGLALVSDSIWYHRKWSSTWKNLFDALLYALVTGGIFLWLRPR